MKKLLSLLGAMGLVATSSSVAVACNNGDKNTTTKDLSTIKGDDLKLTVADNKQATAETAAVAVIKSKLSVEVKKDTDFTTTFTAATKDAEGKLVVTAKDGSTLLTKDKSATFTWDKLAGDQPAAKPVIAVSAEGLQDKAIKIDSSKSNGEVVFNVTISNYSGSALPTLTLGENAAAQGVSVSSDVAKDGSEVGKFKFTLKATKATDAAVTATLKFANAEDFVINVTAK